MFQVVIMSDRQFLDGKSKVSCGRSNSVTRLEPLPIWARDMNALSDRDYADHFKVLTNNRAAPLVHLHVHQGLSKKRSVLINAPYDGVLYIGDPEAKVQFKMHGLSGRYLCLPEYAQEFVSGEVALGAMEGGFPHEAVVACLQADVEGDVITLIVQLSSDKENYARFYQRFGHHLVEAVLEADEESLFIMLSLIRFRDARNADLVSLAELPKDEGEILYATRGDREQLRERQDVRQWVSQGRTVLLLEDEDLELIEKLKTFEGRPFVDIAMIDLPGLDDFCQQEQSNFRSWVAGQFPADVFVINFGCNSRGLPLEYSMSESTCTFDYTHPFVKYINDQSTKLDQSNAVIGIKFLVGLGKARAANREGKLALTTMLMQNICMYFKAYQGKSHIESCGAIINLSDMVNEILKASFPDTSRRSSTPKRSNATYSLAKDYNLDQSVTYFTQEFSKRGAVSAEGVVALGGSAFGDSFGGAEDDFSDATEGRPRSKQPMTNHESLVKMMRLWAVWDKGENMLLSFGEFICKMANAPDAYQPTDDMFVEGIFGMHNYEPVLLPTDKDMQEYLALANAGAAGTSRTQIEVLMRYLTYKGVDFRKKSTRTDLNPLISSCLEEK